MHQLYCIPHFINRIKIIIIPIAISTCQFICNWPAHSKMWIPPWLVFCIILLSPPSFPLFSPLLFMFTLYWKFWVSTSSLQFEVVLQGIKTYDTRDTKISLLQSVTDISFLQKQFGTKWKRKIWDLFFTNGRNKHLRKLEILQEKIYNV